MPLNLPPKLAAALWALDYQEVIKTADRVIPARDVCYLRIRAEIVLGGFAGAENLLGQVSMRSILTPALARFLDLQLAVFKKTNLGEALAALSVLQIDLPQSNFWQAELHFIVGYALNLSDDFQAAVIAHARAAQHYLEAKLPGQAAAAYFNLCTALQHVNAREQFIVSANRLEKLAGETRHPYAILLWTRLNANIAMDAERFADAAASYADLCQHYVQLSRPRDLDSAFTAWLYAAEKSADVALVAAAQVFLAKYRPLFATGYQSRLPFFEEIQQVNFFVPRAASGYVRKLKQAPLDNVVKLKLLDLACSKIAATAQFHLLEQTASLALQLASQSQNSLAVLDFRPYRVIALGRLGYLSRAYGLLESFAADARASNHEERLKRALQLKSMLRMATGSRDRDQILENEVYLDSGHMKWRDQRIDLRTKPRLWKFFYELCRQQQPLPIAEIFRRVYGHNYVPERHARRMNSLLERARRCFPDRHVIERRDTEIAFAPEVIATMAPHDQNSRSMAARREALFRAIRHAPAPLTISKLEKAFTCSRRTLQHDLNYLGASGLIQYSGSTKNRRYRTTDH